MALDAEAEKFQKFMSEVKDIEKRDSELTSDKQIERLLKPGSKYLNLNPYEVLQVDPATPLDQIKKKYKKLSILVHPDKNSDDRDRAQKAFDAVSQAHKILQDEEQVKKIKLILEEAEALFQKKLQEKRREVKRLMPNATIPEDENPEIYCRTKRAVTAKLFADTEIKKQELVDRQQQEKKRERENEIEEEERVKKQKEYEKKWEESRNDRVDDWRNFQKTSTKKAKKNKTFKSFKPPSLKPESR